MTSRKGELSVHLLLAARSPLTVRRRGCDVAAVVSGIERRPFRPLGLQPGLPRPGALARGKDVVIRLGYPVAERMFVELRGNTFRTPTGRPGSR